MRTRRALLAVVAAAFFLPAGASPAAAPKTFSTVNGTVAATAVHLVAGSSAFPNFRTGAVDNLYPLSHAHVDSSPASESIASPADTGPIGQTAATAPAANGGPTVTQPQYAAVKYPPGTPATVTFGNAPGPSATATAKLNDATAAASVASAPIGTGSAAAAPAAGASPGARLRALLVAWRAEFLNAAAARRYPLPATTADTSPDGVFGDASSAHVVFDQAAGVLRLNGESSATNASFGGGMLVIGAVHVKLSVDDDGTAKPTIAIDVGRATVGGVPVTIGKDGVSVNGSQVPGLGDVAAQANDALNKSLAQAGFHVFTVAPEVTTSTNQVTIDATGVHVRFVPQGTPGGVPQENFDQIIGEVFADALAVPGEPLVQQVTPDVTGSLGDGGGGGGGLGSSLGADTSSSGASSGGAGAIGAGGAAASLGPPSTGGARRVVAIHRKPTYLLLLYLMWQFLLLGAAASLWWWRQEWSA